MANVTRTRKVPKEIANSLLDEMRYRCCICRTLIDPQRFERNALSESLEKHHIIHFAKGGQHDCENLVLLCANCHSRVHSRPLDYPVEKLKEKKLHWIRFRDVVPASLVVSGKDDEHICVSCSIESINLQFSIFARPETTLFELSEFAREKILKPLGKYDNNDTWTSVEQVGIAFRSKPEMQLSPSLTLREIDSVLEQVFVFIIIHPLMLAIKRSRFPQSLERTIRQELQSSIHQFFQEISERVTNVVYRRTDDSPVFSQLQEAGVDVQRIIYSTCWDGIERWARGREHGADDLDYEISRIAHDIAAILDSKIRDILGDSNRYL